MTPKVAPESEDLGSSGATNKQAESSSGISGEDDMEKTTETKFGNVWKVNSPLSFITSSNNKVGSSFPSQQQSAASLISFNQQRQLQQALTLPISARRVRDSGSLLFMLAFLSFLGYVIWDGVLIKQTDINLIVHGHDSYGNICGRENKPIKLVEQSGKNYSGKPFTKYTLINAQFERYTLDSDKLKQGELFYIKAQQASQSELELENARNSRAPYPERRGILRRSRRDAPAAQVTSELLAASQRNQTLLKRLRSSLMYQYPQLYGYNNPQQPLPKASDSESAILRRAPIIVPAPTRLQVKDSSASTRLESSVSSASAASRYAARSGYVYSASADSFARRNQSSEATTTTARAPTNNLLSLKTTTSISLIDSPRAVYFDEHLNESDRYDHMLIAPSNTNPADTRPRRPTDGFYANEVSSKLLYLTECVDHCPANHVELIFYRCMPKNWRFSLFPNAINVTRTFIDDIFTDMTHCYKELIYIFSLALVLSLGLLILLRFLASLIIWSCLTLLVGLFLSMTSYAWLNYYYLILDLNNALPNNSVYAEKLSSSDKWLIGAIFLTFVTFAAVATILFMRRRILMVTMLFRESGKAIADMPLLLLQPILTFATLATITVLWAVGLICLQSVKTPAVDMTTGFVVFKSETLYKIMKWYHIFAFLWVSHFAIACQHYVIGASVSKWYFSADRYNLHSPIGTSVSELILYYMGSVALGSLLVAIFKVIKIVIKQIHYLAQRNCMQPHTGQPGVGSSAMVNGSPLIGPQMQASTSWCGSFSYLWRLFIWFFDNIVMIINRDAYVEVAIHGHSFLKGAQRALTVLASNPLRLLAIKSVGSILLVVAKVCVVFGTVSMALVLIDDKTHQLNYSWSPIVISALFAYIVAHWFLSVYEMVIDALFICYCEDYERTKTFEAAANSPPINGSNFMSQILNNGQVY